MNQNEDFIFDDVENNKKKLEVNLASHLQTGDTILVYLSFN